jgi:hypothetical protein
MKLLLLFLLFFANPTLPNDTEHKEVTLYSYELVLQISNLIKDNPSLHSQTLELIPLKENLSQETQRLLRRITVVQNSINRTSNINVYLQEIQRLRYNTAQDIDLPATHYQQAASSYLNTSLQELNRITNILNLEYKIIFLMMVLEKPEKIKLLLNRPNTSMPIQILNEVVTSVSCPGYLNSEYTQINILTALLNLDSQQIKDNFETQINHIIEWLNTYQKIELEQLLKINSNYQFFEDNIRRQIFSEIEACISEHYREAKALDLINDSQLLQLASENF